MNVCILEKLQDLAIRSRGIVDRESAKQLGGHGFDPHCGSVLQISPIDLKYWF
ncbi:hypothetical protein DPMN_132131 [Dreissena polymorpha]|uniref:Uncharacterized protein n=1 Tax=Dreissena polymorpha TaxID=45954 RepID=A0A9D4FVJ0_DREPO|nr:hypothetical protein DPMN_132131 [Dreissena polymorpha]